MYQRFTHTMYRWCMCPLFQILCWSSLMILITTQNVGEWCIQVCTVCTCRIIRRTVTLPIYPVYLELALITTTHKARAFREFLVSFNNSFLETFSHKQKPILYFQGSIVKSRPHTHQLRVVIWVPVSKLSLVSNHFLIIQNDLCCWVVASFVPISLRYLGTRSSWECITLCLYQNKVTTKTTMSNFVTVSCSFLIL